MTTAGSAPKGEAKLRNEAAERLRERLFQTYGDTAGEIDDVILEAEADERRATVERIRERVESLSGVFVLHQVIAILDEEAAR